MSGLDGIVKLREIMVKKDGQITELEQELTAEKESNEAFSNRIEELAKERNNALEQIGKMMGTGREGHVCPSCGCPVDWRAERDRLRKALQHIMRHQKIVAGSLEGISPTYLIAQQALEEMT